MNETCNQPTPNGPCTMPKGHAAQFHRHRVYNKMMWRIKTDHVIAMGDGYVKLQYAISKALASTSKLTIEIEKAGSDDQS